MGYLELVRWCMPLWIQLLDWLRRVRLKQAMGLRIKRIMLLGGTFVDRPFDEHYWDAQALKCLDIKSVGIPQYDGIFASLLEKVFVDLRLWSIFDDRKLRKNQLK